ncbi:MAG: hypothetical protein IKN57_02705, partial [Parasporobacterium sp.]|nr:hypothetical protein [Parasporobacterium sp.]
ELVPGKGTAVQEWLQELFINSGCDGRQLGRNICDMTQNKYGNMDDLQSKELLTWSVLNLEKIKRLADDIDEFYKLFGKAYEENQNIISIFRILFVNAEKYGTEEDGMIDIGSLFYQPLSLYVLGKELREDLLSALTDVVDYSVKGAGRNSSRGISFCYAMGFTKEEIEIYARNCPSPHYLALLDAISSWDAPEELFAKEEVDRLMPVEKKKEYDIVYNKKIIDGLPGLVDEKILSSVYYNLYKIDEETGQMIRLGRSICKPYLDINMPNITWTANDPMNWLSLEGMVCGCELVFSSDNTLVYNIPVEIGGKVWNLRMGREFEYSLLDQMANYNEIIDSGRYNIYGFWEGYDSNSIMPSRNVEALSKKAGQEYQLLFPVIGSDGKPNGDYVRSDREQILRVMEVKENPLPAGTYYIEYEIEDYFGRKIILNKIQLNWDGENISYPEGFTWEGEIILKPGAEYQEVETPQEGTSQEGAPQEGNAQEGAPQEGAPQEGAPQEGAPQEGTPQEGNAQEGAPQEGAPQEGTP